jgi:squalene-hopene/tetraprenyl-beta-curcumene cyclase
VEEQAAIDRSLGWLVAQQRKDGSFSDSNVNYIASAAIFALTAAQDERFKPAIEKARNLVLGLQNVESRGYGRTDRDYGSIGYGGDERGDLSNLQFSLEALTRSGVDPQHDAFVKALVFLQRVQNLKSVNDFKGRTRDEETGAWVEVVAGDDGGSAYYPGNSPAGYVELADGTRIPRSYGSMTYALLKSYTLCGIKGDDPRVAAAVHWIRENWTLDENPGADPRMPEATKYQGLFYYYMVLAQALDLAGVDSIEVTGADGKTAKVDWRKALRQHLESLQQPDGSWVNKKNGRWWEMLPMTCTCYALLALDKCR